MGKGGACQTHLLEWLWIGSALAVAPLGEAERVGVAVGVAHPEGAVGLAEWRPRGGVRHDQAFGGGSDHRDTGEATVGAICFTNAHVLSF